MLEMLTKHLAHDHWANERVLTVLTQDANPAALRLFAHILAAQHVWMLRLRGEDANTPIWPDLSVEECRSLQQRNVEAYTETLSRLTSDGLVHMATYRNSKGATFQTPVGDVLMHVFSHGVYHRGQIALVLRQAGAEPVNTDYITFVRETPSFGH